jgi:hypothetical protein
MGRKTRAAPPSHRQSYVLGQIHSSIPSPLFMTGALPLAVVIPHVQCCLPTGYTRTRRGRIPRMNPGSVPHASLEEQPAVDVADADHPDKRALVDDGDSPEILETHV